MTVVVPGVGVITRKPKWKQLLFPVEIPAARFSCLTSGSFRPRLGLCILLLVLVACLAFIVVPSITKNSSVFPYLLQQRTAFKMSAEEAVKATTSADVKFSADLYNKLAKPTENMVMSSLSVSSVLAMLLAGAKGKTASQIEKSLYQSSGNVMAGFNGIMAALESLKKDSNITLRAANKIYPDSNFQVLPEYKKLLEQNFLASVDNVDFRKNAEGSRKSINGWVEDQTNKKIVELLKEGTVTSDTVMVLVNAIYFKGDWKTKFAKEATREADFYVDDSTTVKVQMMYRKEYYSMLMLPELNNAVALRMPYKGESVDMIFVLPANDDTIGSLEKRLSSIDFSKIKFKNELEIKVQIPRFKIEADYDLTKTLQEMGMSDLFSSEADLSGVSGVNNLYVSTVVQKAFIEVNEDGAEAAAATGGVMMMRAAMREPEFICNRPFYFYIQERKSGIVLFSGKVVNPNKN